MTREEAIKGDAISRQTVKDKYEERLVNNLKDKDRGIDLSKYAEEPYKAFCEFMDSIPPINSQEPRTGHWIVKTYSTKMNDTYYGYECDQCHKEYNLRTNYCPSCGAKMVEPQESEG